MDVKNEFVIITHVRREENGQSGQLGATVPPHVTEVLKSRLALVYQFFLSLEVVCSDVLVMNISLTCVIPTMITADIQRVRYRSPIVNSRPSQLNIE